MFRSDRDALAGEVDDLRAENERLRAENEAMRQEILARRAEPAPVLPGASVYESQGSQLSAGERAALREHSLEAFPLWALLLLSVLTFGLFPLIHFGRMHGRLPRGDASDPTPGKAIGFFFIPFFNVYWLFFCPVRLADRVNLQYVVRGLPAPVQRNLPIAAGVTTLIPNIGTFAATCLWLLAAYRLQKAVNHLAELRTEEAHPTAAARIEVAMPGLRIPAAAAPPAAVDVVAEAEAEAEAIEKEREEQAR
jgi:hypothetical protein